MKKTPINRSVEQIYDFRNLVLGIASSRGLGKEFLENVISIFNEIVQNPNKKAPRTIPISSSMHTDRPPTIIEIR